MITFVVCPSCAGTGVFPSGTPCESCHGKRIVEDARAKIAADLERALFSAGDAPPKSATAWSAEKASATATTGGKTITGKKEPTALAKLLEEMEEPVKTYLATFVGREAGAIGLTYRIATFVDAEDVTQARLNLYREFEYITHLVLSSIDKPASPEALALIQSRGDSLMWRLTCQDCGWHILGPLTGTTVCRWLTNCPGCGKEAVR
jgi:hypothetical protein